MEDDFGEEELDTHDDVEEEQGLDNFEEGQPAPLEHPPEEAEGEPDEDDEGADIEVATELPEVADTARQRIYIRTPADRVFSPRITKYEYSRILAVRSTAIQNGDEHFAPAEAIANVSDPIQIAVAEFRAGMCPLLVIRPRKPATATHGAIYEVWNARELSGLGE